MSELKDALTADGLSDVRTYIQSGNILFTTNESNTDFLAEKVKRSIAKQFKLDIGVAVFEKKEWQSIIYSAPKEWGQDKTWKHNLLVLLNPYDIQQVITAIGEIKPGIEAITPGSGVLYQSVSINMFGRTASGKLAGNPVYKQMTIRNYNTATKLLLLLS